MDDQVRAYWLNLASRLLRLVCFNHLTAYLNTVLKHNIKNIVHIFLPIPLNCEIESIACVSETPIKVLYTNMTT